MRFKKFVLGLFCLCSIFLFLGICIVIVNSFSKNINMAFFWIGINGLLIIFFINSLYYLFDRPKKSKKEVTVSWCISLILCIISVVSIVGAVANGDLDQVSETESISNRYYVSNIEDVYQGTYLPMEFVQNLKHTKSYEKAFQIVPSDVDFIVGVHKNVVNASHRFEEEFSYNSYRVTSFKYEFQDGSIVLINDKNQKYVKISDNLHLNEVVCQYVMKVIFEQYLDVIKVEGNSFEADNNKFTFVSNIENIFNNDSPNLFLSDGINTYSAKLVDNHLNLRLIDSSSPSDIKHNAEKIINLSSSPDLTVTEPTFIKSTETELIEEIQTEPIDDGSDLL